MSILNTETTILRFVEAVMITFAINSVFVCISLFVENKVIQQCSLLVDCTFVMLF